MNEEQTMISKKDTLILKGAAILCVILGHMGYLDMAGVGGVHLFCLLSGYGIDLSVQKNGLEQYWKKRLTAVYLPYFCYALPITFCLVLIFKTVSPVSGLFSILALDFGMLADPTMWYISYIFVWYALYALAARVNDRNPKAALMTALLGCAAIACISALNIVWHSGTVAWAYFASFPAGVLLARVSRHRISPRVRFAGLTLLTAASLFCLAALYGGEHRALNSLVFGMAWAAFVFGALMLMKEICARFGFSGWQNCNPLTQIGAHSFGMYLNEVVLIGCAKGLFPVMNGHARNLLVLAASFLLAAAMDRAVIFPLQRKMRKTAVRRG